MPHTNSQDHRRSDKKAGRSVARTVGFPGRPFRHDRRDSPISTPRASTPVQSRPVHKAKGKKRCLFFIPLEQDVDSDQTETDHAMSSSRRSSEDTQGDSVESLQVTTPGEIAYGGMLQTLSMHSVTPSDPMPPSTPSGDPPNKEQSHTSLLPPWLEKGESYFDFPRGEPSRGRSIQQSPLLPSIMAVQSPAVPPLPFQDLPVPEAVEPLFEMELGEPVSTQQSYPQYATISGAGRRRMRSDSGPWTSHGWPGSMSPDGHIEHKEYVGSISPAQEWLPRSFYQSRKDAHPFDQKDVVNDQPHSGSSRRSSILTNLWEHSQRRITTQPSSTSRADRRRSAL